MENKVKFRNHISIVAEKMGRTAGFLFVFALGILIQDMKEIVNYAEGNTVPLKEIFMGGGGVIILILLIGVYQVLVWSKTFISIDENSIVIERNTVNVKKNTIGIKNISNVNTEQTMFEMLLGTCKLKLDTNSLSTADETDVKILLKKTDAEKLQKYILDLLRQNEMSARQMLRQNETESQYISDTTMAGKMGQVEEMDYDVGATVGDVMIHGLFSIKVVSIVALLFLIAGTIGTVMTAIEEGDFGKGIVETIFSVMAMFLFAISFIRDIADGFIRYYNFKIKRNENKLYIRYGLLKKVNYTIPVDKINALRLKQTMFARLSGMYMAEIINIGMGDEDAEAESFFLPYCKKAKLQKEIEKLLPELAETITLPISKQPRETWIAWLVPYIAYFITLGAVGYVATDIFTEYTKWILLGMTAVTALVILMSVLRYFTAGCTVADNYIVLANGYFGRRLSYISYDKIQHVQLQQNVLAKICRIQKGNIFLLASLVNRVHGIPYFKEQEVEKLGKGIVRKADSKK